MPRIASADVKKTIEKAKKNDRPMVVKFQKADMTMRTMVVASPTFSDEFVKGALPPGKRAKEDKDNNVLTVFSLDVFAELIADGQTRAEAGSNAWRRIPLTRVHRVEVL